MGLWDNFKQQPTKWKLKVIFLFIFFWILFIIAIILVIGGPFICTCSGLTSQLNPDNTNKEGDTVCVPTCKDKYPQCQNRGCSVSVIPFDSNGGSCNPETGTTVDCALPESPAIWGNVQSTNPRFIAGIVIFFVGFMDIAYFLNTLWKVSDSSQQLAASM